MSTGKEVINGREEEPQYMFLGQRLQALEQGWEELQIMWAKQNKVLDQAKEYQAFVRDCKQVRMLVAFQPLLTNILCSIKD